jgi:hypothetical protein
MIEGLINKTYYYYLIGIKNDTFDVILIVEMDTILRRILHLSISMCTSL